jgi:hypothetical protein
VTLSGPHPARQPRLPHHLSLLVRSSHGAWLNGRQLVRALWREGFACSSGSACSSSGSAASAVLLAESPTNLLGILLAGSVPLRYPTNLGPAPWLRSPSAMRCSLAAMS